MECESRIYNAACNCVLYYMPRISEDITICSRSDWGCVTEVRRMIELKYNNSYSCSCLPACFGITYGTEISMASLISNGISFHEEILLDNNLRWRTKDLAIVQIYFRDTFFRSQTREELIGLTEFLCKFCLQLIFGRIETLNSQKTNL